jgi:hypothetical protein
MGGPDGVGADGRKMEQNHHRRNVIRDECGSGGTIAPAEP